MTDVDGVSSRWHSNFSRNCSIFPPPLASFYPTSSHFLLLSRGREKKRERERVGSRRCEQLQKQDIVGEGMIACLGWLVYGDDKEGTNDGRAPFREETYDIGFYARNNARAPAVRAVLQETPTVFLSPSLPRSLFFSISRWSSKAGEEEGRERSGERKGSWSSFAALYRRGVVFLFSFFFPRSTKEYDTKGKGGRVYYTCMNYFTRCFLVEFSFNANENRKRILQKFSRSRSR